MKYRIIVSLAVIVFLMFVFAVPAQSTTLYNGVEHHVYIMKSGDTVEKYAIVHTGHSYNWEHAVVLNPETGSRYTESQYNRLPIGTIVAFPVTKTEQEKASTLVSVPSTAQNVTILRSGTEVVEPTSEPVRASRPGPRYIHIIGQVKVIGEMRSHLERRFTIAESPKTLTEAQDKSMRQPATSIAEAPPVPARANKKLANSAKAPPRSRAQVNTTAQSKTNSPPAEHKVVTEGSTIIRKNCDHDCQGIFINRQTHADKAAEKARLVSEERFSKGSRKEKVVEGIVVPADADDPPNSASPDQELSPAFVSGFLMTMAGACMIGAIIVGVSGRPKPIDPITRDNFTKVGKVRIIDGSTPNHGMRSDAHAKTG